MDPALQQALESAGRHQLRQQMLARCLRAIPWLVLGLIGLFALDIVVHLSAGWREIIRNGLLAAAVALGLAAAAAALLRRQPVLRTARQLEDRLPELDSRLINLLQLAEESRRSDTSELTRQLAEHAVREAARDLPTERFRRALRRRDLPKRFALAAAVVALVALLTGLAGEPGARQWARFADPRGDHPPLSWTVLAIESPAEDGVSVAYRDSLEVEARADGHRPGELLLSARDEAGAVLFTIPMEPRDDGRFAARIHDIRQPLRLFAHTAGERTRSPERHVGVELAPRIEHAELTLIHPPYTARPDRHTRFRFEGIRALTGSTLVFTLSSNRPLGTGRLRYEMPGREPIEVPLTPADPPEQATARLHAEASGRLVFEVVDADGRPADSTPTSSLTVTHDADPSVTLLQPTEDSFVVETMTLELLAEAADDFGIASLRLHAGVDDVFPEPRQSVPEGRDETRVRISHTLDLPALGLRAGQRITVFADALDHAPEPRFGRSETRVLTLITEREYNDYLRRQADVSLIAGKYEEALDQLREAIEEQRSIEEQLGRARDLDPEAATAAVGEALQRQESLNQRLEAIAGDLREVTREQPVYDFERSLGEQLAERAEAIERSVDENRDDLARAIDGSEGDGAVRGAEIDALEQAARAQRERLEGEQASGEEEVLEPLEQLAEFHELLKNFNQLRHLAEEQQRLAGEAAAADRGGQPTAEDRAALRDLAQRQRELGQRLDQLEQKLRQDAERLGDGMSEFAEAAGQLADQLDHQGLSGQARDAAGEMLDGDAAGARQQAGQLRDRLDALLAPQGPAEAGEQAAGSELARLLGSFGMPAGGNFEQLLQSLRFVPPGAGQGGGANGVAGVQAHGMSHGQPQSLLGGESLAGGDIARRLAGVGGGAGRGSGPGARVEHPELAAEQLRSTRRTETPGTATLLPEYEDIADAYFQRLTTPAP